MLRASRFPPTTLFYLAHMLYDWAVNWSAQVGAGMSKIKDHIAVLRTLPEWDAYLIAHANLPGPRGNLELVQAGAEIGDEPRLLAYVAWTSESFDTNDPRVIPLMVGTVGLGRRLAEGSDEHWDRLRAIASDSRWRVREGVAMALQRAGATRFDALLEHTLAWRTGTYLEQRALVAGLCEPALLREPAHARAALQVLDEITSLLVVRAAPHDDAREPRRVLRQALGYCWSVAIAALPDEGWPLFERSLLESWASSQDTDVRWIMRENLSKSRLLRLDPGRVEALRQRLAAASPVS
jgi:hypothetical protein